MSKKWLGMACLLVVTTTISAQKRYVAPFRVTDDSTIVKIGYADGNNKTMSGSVDQITEEHMNKGLMTNPLDALSGKAAGVSISSQEAMISAVRVRGTTSLTGGNDPLVIIDGVSSDLATLSTVYPADIESFTILKDASETAQYGSRGASGVIQVATKKGRNEQFHISYDGNIGWESIYKNIEMLSGSEFAVQPPH
jgi:TonB-dependent SusC/RagA subfamily outer membrane receptor